MAKAMADKSNIQWCDATINPCVGCTPVSPACDNCYAARMAARMCRHPNPKIARLYAGLTDAAGKWTGKINLNPEAMEKALRWKRPRRIFVGSMTDLFHEAVPDSFLDQIFTDMALAQQHTFILLTKRPERMLHYIQGVHDEPVDTERDMALFDPWRATWGELYGQRPWPMRNVILMTTVEDQPRADERLPIMAELGGRGWTTGVSVEPMLGPVNVAPYFTSCPHCGWWEIYKPRGDRAYCQDCGQEFDAPAKGLSWVIAGGESGPGARPMHPAWVRSLRDQCKRSGVPFLFKQWGEWTPTDASGRVEGDCDISGGFRAHRYNWADGSRSYRVGKHRAGRLLDGVEYNQFPEGQP